MKQGHSNIKRRILIPLAVVLFLLLSTSVIAIYQMQNRHITQIVGTKLSSVDKLFKQLLLDDGNMLSSQIDYFDGSRSLQSAWLNKDRERLYQLSKPIFENISNKYAITHFYYISKDKTCFLRVHSPAYFGDPIKRVTLEEARRTGKQAQGIELGTFGTFTLRVVRPWMIDGEVEGYIELGMDIGHITPKLQQSLNSELIFTVDKKHLKRDLWEKGRQILGTPGDWDALSRAVILDATINIDLPELDREMDAHYHKHTRDLFSFSKGDTKYRGGYIPLQDAGGTEIGDIIVLNDVTEQVGELYSFVAVLILVSLVISQLLMVFFHNYIGGIEQTLLKSHADLQAEIEDHKKTEAELHNYHDHLKDLVRKRTEALNESNEELKRDIAKRNEVEEELRRQSQFVMSLYESLSHPFYVISVSDYSVVLANSATTTEPYEGLATCYALTHNSTSPCSGKDHPCPLEEVKRTGKPYNVEHIHSDVNGNTVIQDIHGYPIYDVNGQVIQMIEYVLDVTERRRIEEEKARLESQLNQSQKLETVGELVDTVAHEINTPTGVIAAHADAMLLQIGDSGEHAEGLRTIRKQTRRISRYTRSLLEYSQRVQFQPNPARIQDLIGDCIYLLGHRFRAQNITVSTTFPDNLPEITVDKLQIEQVCINLLNNAVDSIGKNGEIHISVDQVPEDTRRASPASVRIEVRDNGKGIKPDDLPHVFEPFYTTKLTSRGTGLGLSISKAIIQRHHGTLIVSSVPGEGAVFTIILPISNRGKKV
ncbi:MAG: PAS domain-containing protein [FCB group bacterium]|nr:PAS domain-containing protein [FCB group bacterium]